MESEGFDIYDEVKNLQILEGLTLTEVEQRVERGDVNVATENITKTNKEIIFDNVFTLFNFYNLLIACALLLVGAYSNMSFFAIIVLNSAIGVIQELQARKMVEKLSILSQPKATVIREGKKQEIVVTDLVLDDLLYLATGDQIPADAEVVSGELEVNEALLTGESEAIVKQKGTLLLSGSAVMSGHAYASIKHVGSKNYAHQIVHEAKQHKRAYSELLTAMQKTTKFTSYFILPLGIILFFEAIFLRGDNAQIAVIATAAALLGMLPKGLMLLISISLASGVIKLSKEKVLVQDLYALESLAHVDVLCLDKTGTITEGKMQVDEFISGKNNHNQEIIQKDIALTLKALEDNNATFQALENYFMKFIEANDIPDTQVVVPFSSQRKWSGVTFVNKGSMLIGAPDRLLSAQDLSMCEQYQDAGKRVLAVVYSPDAIVDKEIPNTLLFLGLITLIDPIRKNAKETIDFFKQEAVAIKIISGDDPRTVSHIAKEIGLADYDSYIDLSAFENETEIAEVVDQYLIFGRVTPQHKKMLVQALQQRGHKVAMTGDGVNDILAMKEAEVGISIAEASDAARQIAKLVLLTSDFNTLPKVVMEGRRVVNNITRSAGVFFIKTIYSIILSCFYMITLGQFPFIPTQITLIDLAIEGYPAFFSSFEPDNRAIRGSFLKNVLQRALPNGITTAIVVIISGWIATMFLKTSVEIVTLQYYLVSFVGILGVAKALYPYNALRIFLLGSTIVGFYGVILLFPKVLHLTYLSSSGWQLFIVFALLSIGLERSLHFFVHKFVR